MAQLLADTTLVIDRQRELRRKERGGASVFWEDFGAGREIGLSLVSVGELAEGVPPEERPRLFRLLEPFEILGLSEEIAWVYGIHCRRLRAGGMLIGANDLWIGCSALALGLPLVSRNDGHFRRIEGLTVLSYR